MPDSCAGWLSWRATTVALAYDHEMSDDSAQTVVDLLITGSDIVTMDAANPVILDGAIAVTGNEIVWIGPRSDARFSAQTELHVPSSIACPGLIDSHFHTAQHFLRGVIAAERRRGQLDVPIWRHYLVPFEAALSKEDVRLSAEVAYAELLVSGTTCVAEAGGPHADEMARAAVESGIRAFVARSTADQGNLPESMMASTQDNIDETMALLDRWPSTPVSRVSAWTSLRQILVCSDELWQSMNDLARDRRVRVHTKLCEGSYEVDYAAERWRCRPTEHLADIGVFNDQLHTAHAILLTDSDVDLYGDLGPSIAHCPMQNFVIGPGKVPMLRRRNVAVGLGTDGAVFNPTLDLLATARVAGVVGQAIHGTPSHVQATFDPQQLLAMATGDHARTVGMEGRLGMLAPGRIADLVIHDVSGFESLPGVDPIITLADTLGRATVDTVVVDGQVVVRRGEHQLIDVEELMWRARKRVPELLANVR